MIVKLLADGTGGGTGTETLTPAAGEVAKPLETGTPVVEGGGEGGDGTGAEKPEKQTPFHQHPDWIKHQERMKAAETKAAELERTNAEILAQLEELTQTPAEPTVFDTLKAKLDKGEELTQQEMLSLMAAQRNEFQQMLAGSLQPIEEKNVVEARMAVGAKLMKDEPFFAVGKFPETGRPGNVLAFHVLGNLAAEADPTGKDMTLLPKLAPTAKELVMQSLPDLVAYAAEAKDPGLLAKLPAVLEKLAAAKDPGVVKFIETHAKGYVAAKEEQNKHLAPGGGGEAAGTKQNANLAETVEAARERVRKKFGL